MKKMITELQSLGVRMPVALSHGISRNGGAGPAEGRALIIDGIAVNVPMQAQYVINSPFYLDLIERQLWLFLDDRPQFPVNVVSQPQFYNMKTNDGIPYHHIALLHGKSCLASTIFQNCVYWGTPQQCHFCAIGVSLQKRRTIPRKSPEQLAEVAKAAAKEGINHVVLTSGTTANNKEIEHLAECALKIRKLVDLPVHAQFSPPRNLERLNVLKDSGVETVGIHVESFDLETLKRVAPAKATLGYECYKTAWREAVKIFGPNQVSSFLIVGLGETVDSVVEGSQVMADMGVYPYIVPLRPTPGSRMEMNKPPSPDSMEKIYTRVASILKVNGLSSKNHKAGCVRCGACSALSWYETDEDHLICHITRTASELERAFQIRREVFVDEQHLFSKSDVDENDPRSIHLVCEQDGQVIGTVRMYPLNNNGHWIGGRLAVDKFNRSYRAGALLVREAMKRVKQHGCQKFTAEIQIQNIPFFERLGWHAVGKPEHHLGILHQTMIADLNKV